MPSSSCHCFETQSGSEVLQILALQDPIEFHRYWQYPSSLYCVTTTFIQVVMFKLTTAYDNKSVVERLRRLKRRWRVAVSANGTVRCCDLSGECSNL